MRSVPMVPDSETEKSGRKDGLIMAHASIFFPESINSIKNLTNLLIDSSKIILDLCNFFRCRKKKHKKGKLFYLHFYMDICCIVNFFERYIFWDTLQPISFYILHIADQPIVNWFTNPCLALT